MKKKEKTGKSFSGNREVTNSNYDDLITATKKDGNEEEGENREVIFREPGSHFLGTGKSFSGNWEVIFREPGRQFDMKFVNSILYESTIVLLFFALFDDCGGEAEKRLIDLLGSRRR